MTMNYILQEILMRIKFNSEQNLQKQIFGQILYILKCFKAQFIF